MKKLIYLTYLGLLAAMLVACEKETVAPVQETASLELAGTDAKKGCTVYSYYSNSWGNVIFGNARPDVLFVGFRKGMTLARQHQILSLYPAYLSIEQEYDLHAGTFTIVNLKPGMNCSQVAAMLKSLENRPLVRFAAPVFDPGNTNLKWRGLTNQVIVNMKDTTSGPALRLLCRQTNTRVVGRLTKDIFLVGLDKYSAGDALRISSLFNRSPKVLNAEPDLLLRMLPFFVNDPNRVQLQNTVARKYADKKITTEQL